MLLRDFSSTTSKKPPAARTSIIFCHKCGVLCAENVYKCLNCPDYVICGACKTETRASSDPPTQSAHPANHLFVVLAKNLGEDYRSIPLIPEPISLSQDQWSFDEQTGKILHPGVLCDKCNKPVAGFRYKCGNCTDYDLCEDCWSSGASAKHPETHVLLCIPRPFQAPTEKPLHPLFGGDVYDRVWRERSRTMLNHYYSKSCMVDELSQASIPLTGVRVQAIVVDFLAEVTVQQTFTNRGPRPLEAVYAFPLEPKAAVHAFQVEGAKQLSLSAHSLVKVEVDGRVVLGKVEEKLDAKDKYDDAIASGHGAYLMEQSEQMPDVFTCKVGNLAPGKNAVVTLSYQIEIDRDDGVSLLATAAGHSKEESATPCLRFTLPMAIAPRYMPMGLNTELMDAPSHGRASDNSSNESCALLGWLGVPPAPLLAVDLVFAQSSGLRALECPTHHGLLLRRRHADAADAAADAAAEVVRASLSEPCLDRDIVLLLKLRRAPGTALWLEPPPPPPPAPFAAAAAEREDVERESLPPPRQGAGGTLMVEAYPDLRGVVGLEEDGEASGEFIFVLDRSGSMAGSRIKAATEALCMCLSSLPEGSKFNVFSFGNSYTSLHGRSVALDDRAKDSAVGALKQMKADMGGTGILGVLRAAAVASAAPGGANTDGAPPPSPRVVLLFTDGKVGNTADVVSFVHGDSLRTGARYFAFGIGEGASRGLVSGVAEAGQGRAEFILEGERLQTKVLRQLRYALVPGVAGATVRSDFGTTVIPQVLPPLFQEQRLLFFSYLDAGAAPPTEAVLEAPGRGGGPLLTLELPSPPRAVPRPSSFSSSPVGPPWAAAAAATGGGRILRRAAARHRLRELEQGYEKADTKSGKETCKTEAIEFSIEHNITCKWTAFIAVEERQGETVSGAVTQVRVPLSIAPAKPRSSYSHNFQPNQSLAAVGFSDGALHGAADGFRCLPIAKGKGGGMGLPSSRGRRSKKKKSKDAARPAPPPTEEASTSFWGRSEDVKLEQISDRISATSAIAKSNIDQIVRQSDQLEEILTHSESLTAASKQFYKPAKKSASSRMGAAMSSVLGGLLGRKAKSTGERAYIGESSPRQVADELQRAHLGEIPRQMSGTTSRRLAENRALEDTEDPPTAAEDEDEYIAELGSRTNDEDIQRRTHLSLLESKKVQEKKQLPSPSQHKIPAADLSVISRLLELQRTAGQWVPSAALAALLGAAVLSIPAAAAAGEAGEGAAAAAAPALEGEVWATLLALAFLARRFPAQEDEWALSARKARRWLSRGGWGAARCGEGTALWAAAAAAAAAEAEAEAGPLAAAAP